MKIHWESEKSDTLVDAGAYGPAVFPELPPWQAEAKAILQRARHARTQDRSDEIAPSRVRCPWTGESINVLRVEGWLDAAIEYVEYRRERLPHRPVNREVE